MFVFCCCCLFFCGGEERENERAKPNRIKERGDPQLQPTLVTSCTPDQQVQQRAKGAEHEMEKRRRRKETKQKPRKSAKLEQTPHPTIHPLRCLNGNQQQHLPCEPAHGQGATVMAAKQTPLQSGHTHTHTDTHTDTHTHTHTDTHTHTHTHTHKHTYTQTHTYTHTHTPTHTRATEILLTAVRTRWSVC